MVRNSFKGFYMKVNSIYSLIFLFLFSYSTNFAMESIIINHFLNNNQNVDTINFLNESLINDLRPEAKDALYSILFHNAHKNKSNTSYTSTYLSTCFAATCLFTSRIALHLIKRSKYGR